MDNITFSVFWQLGQEVIELGKPLILQCSIVGMDHIPSDKSRQWTGEINNRLFTFNGVSTCPSNYTEILEPPNSFKIYFNYTSMINLNSPYTCRVGTMFDEKILKVNESNFVCKFMRFYITLLLMFTFKRFQINIVSLLI